MAFVEPAKEEAVVCVVEACFGVRMKTEEHFDGAAAGIERTKEGVNQTRGDSPAGVVGKGDEAVGGTGLEVQKPFDWVVELSELCSCL